MSQKPSAKQATKKRILISSFGASRDSAAEMQRGFRRFARNRPEWTLGWLDPGSTSDREVEQALAWKPDGIVVLERSDLQSALLEVPLVPRVMVDLHHDQPESVSRVEIDDQAIGAEVAEYFLRNRFEHFAVVVWPGNPPFSALREHGFARTVAEVGVRVDRFEVQDLVEQPWHDVSAFEQWISNLPKPVALYAVQDELAQQVLQVAQRLEIRIPLELSLVGMKTRNDFDEGKRWLTSYIQHPFEEAGYRAAELLDEQLQHQDVEGEPEQIVRMVPPANLLERESSSFRQIPDPHVAKAVTYLMQEFLSGGTISGAVQTSGMNRRSLERAFQKHLGVSPGGFIRELKLDHAKKLLSETDLRVWEVARDCKLTQEHFITVFRETVGQTPSQYRKARKAVRHVPVR